MNIQKIEMSNNEFFNLIGKITSDCRICSSYFNCKYDFPEILPFKMDKFQLEYLFLTIERAKASPFYTYTPKRFKHRVYDMIDGPMQMVNFLLGVVRDVIEDGVEIDHFKYYMRILKYFVNVHKFILLEKEAYSLENPKDNVDIKNNITDFYYDEYYLKYVKGLPDFFIQYENTPEKAKIVEEFISKNIECFTEYFFTSYNSEYSSKPRLISTWQNIFPFSEEFLREKSEFFYVPFLVKNPKAVNTKEKLNIIFKDILERNLNDIIYIESFGISKKRITITPEKLEEYVLLYFVNS